MADNKKINYGVSGIEDLVADVNGNSESSVGQAGAIEIPHKKSSGRSVVRTKGTSRTSITLDPEVMGTLRYICFSQGRQLNSIIEAALIEYFKNHRAEIGEVNLPEIYRHS